MLRTNNNRKRHLLKKSLVMLTCIAACAVLLFNSSLTKNLKTISVQKGSFIPFKQSYQEHVLLDSSLDSNVEPGQAAYPFRDSASLQKASYLLLNTRTNEIIFKNKENVKRAPASTVKLLTGLLAIQTLKPDQTVKVGNEVLVDGSRLGLQPGDEITVHNLLTAMYLASANDAAAALAVKTSGSVSSFVQEMNRYAESLGCTDSNFTTPHGLPDPYQYTTAEDLTKIARSFLQNEQLMFYVKKKEETVEWKSPNGIKHQVHLYNTNQLLGIYPGIEGLKTGTTTEAGQCLVSYFTNKDAALLLILLGSEHRYVDTIQLIDQGFAVSRPVGALRNLAVDPNSFMRNPGFFTP